MVHLLHLIRSHTCTCNTPPPFVLMISDIVFYEDNIIQRTLLCTIIIQILTATVMKYHFSVDCQESYIFPRGYIYKFIFYI